MNISTLSDLELRKALIKRGLNPGPINHSTRCLYERQLANLTTNESVHVVDRAQDSSESAKLPEDVNVVTKVPKVLTAIRNEEPEAEEPEAPVVRTLLRDSRGAGDVGDVLEGYEDCDMGADSDASEEFSRVLSEEEIRLNASQRSPARSNSSGMCAKVCWGVAIVAMLVFLFFVLDNVESDSSSNNREEI